MYLYMNNISLFSWVFNNIKHKKCIVFIINGINDIKTFYFMVKLIIICHQHTTLQSQFIVVNFNSKQQLTGVYRR